MKNPFAPVPLRPPSEEIVYANHYDWMDAQIREGKLIEKLDNKGNVVVYERVGQHLRVVADRGHIRHRAKKALYEAALRVNLTFEDIDELNLCALDKAAMHQALKAANGDSSAAIDMFDRIIGKPKQQIEQRTMTLTLDDVLKGVGDDEHECAGEDSVPEE